MSKLYLTIAAVMFCTAAAAKTSKADRLFEQWEYFKAAQLYEQEAKLHPGADVYFKLGECYRKMHTYKKEEQAAGDYVNAAGTYSKPEFYLNYGQVLKSNGRYNEAKTAFNKYNELVPSDPRGKFYSSSIDIVTEDHLYDEPITISNVTTLNTIHADFSPVFYKDGIVFTSSRTTPEHHKIFEWTGANYLDLYYAKGGSNDTVFSDLAPFGGKNIDKKFSDGTACFSKDGNTMYVSRVEKYLKGADKKSLKIERNKIFIATMENGKWDKAVPFPYNSNSYSVANPFLSADGFRLYFASDMPGGYGETDIYYCDRNSNGWDAPVNLGANVNTFGGENFPNMDEAGNFYFSSDGYQGFGGMDICVALNKNGNLQKAIPMKYPINSSTDDYSILFLKNGKSGYVSSDRTDGRQGDADILYFDMDTNKVNKEVVPSIYTIGYRPAKQPVRPLTMIHTVVKPTFPPFKTHNLINDADLENTAVYFNLDEFYIRPDAIMHLDSVVTYMKQSPTLHLVLGGHCDSRGTSGYNMTLSNNRNNAVIAYLNTKGISPKRIVATGYGLNVLVNDCPKGVTCSDMQHQLNRRVDIHFEGKRIGKID